MNYFSEKYGCSVLTTDNNWTIEELEAFCAESHYEAFFYKDTHYIPCVFVENHPRNLTEK